MKKHIEESLGRLWDVAKLEWHVREFIWTEVTRWGRRTRRDARNAFLGHLWEVCWLVREECRFETTGPVGDRLLDRLVYALARSLSTVRHHRLLHRLGILPHKGIPLPILRRFPSDQICQFWSTIFQSLPSSDSRPHHSLPPRPTVLPNDCTAKFSGVSLFTMQHLHPSDSQHICFVFLRHDAVKPALTPPEVFQRYRDIVTS